jgi:hypothetical protein
MTTYIIFSSIIALSLVVIIYCTQIYMAYSIPRRGAKDDCNVPAAKGFVLLFLLVIAGSAHFILIKAIGIESAKTLTALLCFIAAGILTITYEIIGEISMFGPFYKDWAWLTRRTLLAILLFCIVGIITYFAEIPAETPY